MDPQLDRAAALRHLRRFDEALATVDEVLTREPDDADALLERARILLAADRHEEALTVAAAGTPATPLSEPAVFAVSRARTRVVVVFMIALLVFFISWPWPVVTGDHPTRDSFIFAGMGIGFWLLILGLVWQESFLGRYPAVLELHPDEIRWRHLRHGWRSRPRIDLVSASVETDIRYVKGFPGYLYPLVITFAGGEAADSDNRVEIDLMRAKHMRTSTRFIAEEIRRRYFDASRLEDSERAASVGWLATAESAPAPSVRIDALQRAVARYPSGENIARYREIVDLLRAEGRDREAVSSYRAHLDHAPDDAQAWEGLAAAYRSLGRDDLAAEATDAAERILLR